MTPNLLTPFLYLDPRRWQGVKSEGSQPLDYFEHRNTPVRGLYRYYTGRGWYLIEEEHPGNANSVVDTQCCGTRRVVYSLVLHRWLFEPDFNDRRRQGYLPPYISPQSLEYDRKRTWIDDKNVLFIGRPDKRRREVGFFQMDDGITWIQCYDKHGNFLEGPWRRYVFDYEDDKGVHFREMLKVDSRQVSAQSSRATTPPRTTSYDCDLYTSQT